MNFIDLLFENDGITLTPFTLFSIGKRKLFGRTNSLHPSRSSKSSLVKELALKGDMALEKIAAEFAKDSGIGKEGTLYALTNEQIEVMENILDKYGYKIYREIKNFRRKVLAPYEVLKRHVKKNSRVTAKEVYGLTKEEFLAAYESGRKKIENMGNKFVDDSRNIIKTIKNYESTINDIQEIKRKFIESGEYNDGVLEKLFSKIGAGTKDFGVKLNDEDRSYSLKKVKKIIDNYDKSIKELKDYYNPENVEAYNKKIRALELDNSKTWEQKRTVATKIKKEFEKEGRKKLDAVIDSLKDSSGKSVLTQKAFKESYFPLLLRGGVREAIRNIAKENGSKDYYYYFYIKLVDEWIKRTEAHKNDRVQDLEDLNNNLEFTENEAKIFKLKSGAEKYSSNINDYKQLIKIEDFPEDAYIPVKKDPELIRAMDKFEREIRKFENKLKTIISDEDLALLKKYRLINNLIKIKELDDPEKLFKSEDEIERVFKTSKKSEDEMEYNVETKEKDSHYIRQIENELDKAKRFKSMKDETKFRAQKAKLRDLIKEFRRVDIKANKKLARFADDFDSLNFKVLYSGEED